MKYFIITASFSPTTTLSEALITLHQSFAASPSQSFAYPHRIRRIKSKMAPKKKVERAATENISLGPQVREGKHPFPSQTPANHYLAYRDEKLTFSQQVNSSSALLAFLLPSMTPSSMSPISRKRSNMQIHNWLSRAVRLRNVALEHRLIWVIPVAAKPSLVSPVA